MVELTFLFSNIFMIEHLVLIDSRSWDLFRIFQIFMAFNHQVVCISKFVAVLAMHGILASVFLCQCHMTFDLFYIATILRIRAVNESSFGMFGLELICQDTVGAWLDKIQAFLIYVRARAHFPKHCLSSARDHVWVRFILDINEPLV